MFKPVHNGDRIRYSYARIKEVLKMPHLIDLQRKSYEWFIREGLHDVFKDVSPIKDFTDNLELSFENFTIGDPQIRYRNLQGKGRHLCGASERGCTAAVQGHRGNQGIHRVHGGISL